MLFDSHAHLDDKAFDNDRNELIRGLYDRGISYVLNASSDVESSKASVKLAEEFDFIYAAAGIHPEFAKACTEADIECVKSLLKHKKCVALGEIGLDYYYNTDSVAEQKFWFDRQLSVAEEKDMPVIIHDRDAHGDCLEIVKRHKARGVFHCFSGSVEMARELISLGYYISFTGVLTFKNARKAVDVAKDIPIERILIETDCPYMAPEPYRGKRNDPGYVYYTAEKLAEIKGKTVEEIAEITKRNTFELFSIGN